MAYVLLRSLGQMCQRAGLGNESRKVFDEIARPTKAQAVLLQMLRLHLPQRMKIHKNVVPILALAQP